jgi:hypothetical protein
MSRFHNLRLALPLLPILPLCGRHLMTLNQDIGEEPNMDISDEDTMAQSSSSRVVTGAVTTSPTSTNGGAPVAITSTSDTLASSDVRNSTETITVISSPTVVSTVEEAITYSTTISASCPSTQNDASLNGTAQGTTHSFRSSGSEKVPTTALIGDIIGTTVVAALVTFFVTFYYMRRLARKQKGLQISPALSESEAKLAGFSDWVRNSSAFEVHPSIQIGIPWEQYLPDGLEDTEIQNAVSALFGDMECYVENNYTEPPYGCDLERALELCSRWSSPCLASLKAQTGPRVPTFPIIKHHLALILTGAIMGTSTLPPSLLPPRYALVPDEQAMEESFGQDRIGEI